jgi:DNA helicase II / ATP-dependent DNA helicase PcrA
MSWEKGLRSAQAFVAGGPRGHTVMLAGPGTGKTFVLVRRIQYLIEVEEVPPKRITALTFTRAAAAEMRSRLAERLGAVGETIRVATLHSFALSALLKADASSIQDPLRVVGDWEERNVVVEELSEYLGRSARAITESLHLLADDWDTLSADNDGWEDGYPDPQFLMAWRRHRRIYRYTLRSELVYQLLLLLRSSPSFNPLTKHSVLLIDEYQDLNSCDLKTIALLQDNADAEVFAAGDDDQSIYSFRKAHPAGIRIFQDEYEGANQETLEECLRCGSDVVEIASWLISQEPERVPKALQSVTEWSASVHLLRFADQDEEAEEIARLIEKEIDRGTPAHEILILLKADRGGKYSKQLDENLTGLGIGVYQPRVGAGIDSEIEQVFEFLVLAARMALDGQADNFSIRALLEMRPNGIGAKRIRNVVRYCFDNGTEFLEAIDRFRTNASEFPGSGLGALLVEVDEILRIADSLRPVIDEDFDVWVERAFANIGVSHDKRQELDRILGPLLAEFEGLPQEERAERDYIGAVIGAMTSLSDTKPAKIEGNVTITTMHGAKGLSSELVIVLQAEDEIIPGEVSALDEDEARRLLYVSLTRAKERLIITACERRTGNQRFVGTKAITNRSLTRFLQDYGLRIESVAEYFSRAAFFQKRDEDGE